MRSTDVKELCWAIHVYINLFAKVKEKKVTAQIALEILHRAFRQDAFFVPPGKKTITVFYIYT